MVKQAHDPLAKAMRISKDVRQQAPRKDNAQDFACGIEELFRLEMIARRARLNKWMRLIEKEYGPQVRTAS